MPMVAIATTDNIEIICIEHRRSRVPYYFSDVFIFLLLLCSERFCIVAIDPTKDLLTFIYLPVDLVQYALHMKRHAKSKNDSDAVNGLGDNTDPVFR